MKDIEPAELLRVRHLSLTELEESDPELHGRIREAWILQAREEYEAVLPKKPKDLRRILERVDLAQVFDGGTEVASLVEQYLALATISSALRDSAAEWARQKLPAGAPSKVDRTRPLGTLPEFEPRLNAAELNAILGAAKLSPKQAGAVRGAVSSVAELDDRTLSALVTKGTLDEASAAVLGLQVTLSRLVGDPKTASGLVAPLAAAGATTVPDLARLSADQWKEALTRAGLGPSASAIAERAVEGLGRLYPSVALAAALAREAPKSPPPKKWSFVAKLSPDLGIEELLADSTLSENDKSARIEARVSALRRAMAAEPDLARASLSSKPITAALEGVSADDREAVLGTLKAYQRVLRWGGDTETTLALVRAGMTSAIALANSNPSELARRVGASKTTSKRLYEQASFRAKQAMHPVWVGLDLWGRLYDGIGILRGGPTAKDFLGDLPNAASLFGHGVECACEDCRSLLIPAAYFVDLMHLVEGRILPGATNLIETHVLHPKKRRPDLWTMPLSCANTDEDVRYIDLVIEILARFVSASSGSEDPEPAAFAILANTVSSPREPFERPHESAEQALSCWNSSRGELARQLGGDGLLAFSLTLVEVGLITGHPLAPVSLKDIFDLPIPAGGGALGHVDTADAVRATGLSRQDLEQALSAKYVAQPRTPDEKVVSFVPRPGGVQNDGEDVVGLTTSILDRLHRFLRLQRHTPWSILELDLLLERSGGALDSRAPLDTLVAAARVGARLGLDAESLCTVLGTFPTRSANPDAPLPGVRRFGSAAPVLPGDVHYLHPRLDPHGDGVRPELTARLMAGLGVDEDSLVLLLQKLFPAPSDPPSSTSDGTSSDGTASGTPEVVLDVATLGQLARHASVADALGLDISGLFRVLHLSGVGDVLHGVEDTLALTEWIDWQSASVYSLDDVGSILSDATLDEDVQHAASVIEAAGQEGRLTFADTVFALLLGTPTVTSGQSHDIVTQLNPSRFARDGKLYRLADGFDFSIPIEVPADLTGREPDLRAALQNHASDVVLTSTIADQLASTAAEVKAWMSWLGVDPKRPDLADALRGDGDRRDELNSLMARLRRLKVAMRGLDAEEIAMIGAHQDVFAAGPDEGLTMDTLRALEHYRSLRSPEVDPLVWDELLASYSTAPQGFKSDAQLAVVLQTDEKTATTVRTRFAIPPGDDAFAALERMAHALALAKELGVGVATVADLLREDDASALQQAADAVWAQAKNADAASNRLRMAERDALVDYLIRAFREAGDDTPPFESADDLYGYFLIDVEMGACAHTTKLAAAISSVQLYIQRCRMNLEQDRRAEDDPQKVRVTTDLTPDEWAWRRSYRLWEANRKVFLYPEEYLEPTLRDDKTPLFEALEQELLQARTFDAQAVLDAYSRYLRGFEEVATLEIAGAYYDTVADNLHLFGCTADQPPVYYHRMVGGLAAHEQHGTGVTWEPWRRIDVQVPVRNVSAIIYESRLLMFWVRIETRSLSQFVDGNSWFTGYEHHLTVQYSWLRPDGSWTAPQTLPLYGVEPFTDDGVVSDPLNAPVRSNASDRAASTDGRPPYTPRYDSVPHPSPRKGYTLRGPRWDRVYPDVLLPTPSGALHVTGADFQLDAYVDVLRKTLSPMNHAPQPERRYLTARPLSAGEHVEGLRNVPASSTVLFETAALSPYFGPSADAARYLDAVETMPEYRAPALYATPLLAVPDSAELQAVGGDVLGAVIHGPAKLLLTAAGYSDGGFTLHRLDTGLVDALRGALFDDGISALLDTDFQLSLADAPTGYALSSYIVDDTGRSIHEWNGPLGTYWREIFFHAPLLIATHLAALGRYESAERWFRYVFDPTAAPESGTDPHDAVWRYAGFRGLTPERLRAMLEDPDALLAYAHDPFNPHAIARLRPTAYAKSVFLRYVENLLDWGDSLFVQFTRESVNEATQLYIMAYELLGDPPVGQPDCGDGVDTDRSYEDVAPLLRAGEDVLVASESAAPMPKGGNPPPKYAAMLYVDPAILGDTTSAATKAGAGAKKKKTSTSRSGSKGAVLAAYAVGAATGSNTGGPTITSGSGAKKYVFRDTSATRTKTLHFDGQGGTVVQESGSARAFGGFETGIATQLNAMFCVPPAQKLDALRKRVRDRLFKIRHCQNIDGQFQQLAPFAPPIDPELLVRAQAAGISLDDVLAAGSGRVPPYRFSFLIERAKSHAQSVASIGSALQSALEKKDAEDLELLRLTHQKNLLALQRRVRDDEVRAAEQAKSSVERRRDAATYRRDYYQGLVSAGLNAGERTAQALSGAALAIKTEAFGFNLGAAIAHLVPQVGAPTAMTFGGKQVGSSLESFGAALSLIAGQLEAMGGAAGTQAGYQRRSQEWEHQRQLAQYEIDQLDRELAAADIRLAIAQRSLDVHEETEQQADELYERYKDKLTGLGLYTFLATQLTRLHRDAFEATLSMARLAERALRYERDDRDTPTLSGDYWEASSAGLSAGQRLLFDLDRLETWFLETDHRKLEVDQTFSLADIAPEALWTLKETGDCAFSLPQFYFDLVYPGQYKRLIKAVRLTIPAVAGPHVNIGATLELTDSTVYHLGRDGSRTPESVPPQHTARIATSRAQNDSGLFELHFGDSRYLPFEGAGAISTWTLRLPPALRAFDYESIEDVLIHVAYTAEYDEDLRARLEEAHRHIEGTLRTQPLARVISLRRELGDAFQRLVREPLGTEVAFEIKPEHYPFFLRGQSLTVRSAYLAVRPREGHSTDGLGVQLDGVSIDAWTTSADARAGLPSSRDLSTAFGAASAGTHRITITASPDDAQAAIEDLLLFLELSVG